MRVKRGVAKHARHKKVLKAAKGYYARRSKAYKTAKEAVLHAGAYAYVGRKLRKRDMRSLWITKLSAAVRQSGISYSKFINALKKANVELDRKILAQIAERHPQTFKKILENVMMKA